MSKEQPIEVRDMAIIAHFRTGYAEAREAGPRCPDALTRAG